ncbi:MAG: hypothetical protein ACI8Y4_004045 [Candidatus Poriferisodalaceae bacterium]
MQNSKGHQRISLVRALTLAVIVVAGCSTRTEAASRRDDSTRNEDGFIVSSGQIGILELRPGDCFQAWGVGAVEMVDAVPCREEHDRQVVATFDLAESGWPGITQVSEASIARCLARFRDATTTGYDPTVTALTALAPTESSWADDRSVLCIVESATDERLRGSVVSDAL